MEISPCSHCRWPYDSWESLGSRLSVSGAKLYFFALGPDMAELRDQPPPPDDEGVVRQSKAALGCQVSNSGKYKKLKRIVLWEVAPALLPHVAQVKWHLQMVCSPLADPYDFLLPSPFPPGQLSGTLHTFIAALCLWPPFLMCPFSPFFIATLV